MTKFTGSLCAGVLLALGMACAPAQAGATRTWVSGKGSDSGPCALASPCRTFQYAHDQTAAGGEINVLDPAGYGSLTITKAISIINDGVGEAGIQANGPGISINAGTSDTIHLRGLTLLGTPTTGGAGIDFKAGGFLEVLTCTIRKFGTGISIRPSNSSASTSSIGFSISNSFLSDNGGGIDITPLSGPFLINGVIDKVTLSHNGFIGLNVFGGYVTGAIGVTIVNSVTSNHSNYGIYAASQTGQAAVSIIMRNSVANYNLYGLYAGQNASIRMGHSVVAGSWGTGITIGGGGTIYSFGDNDIGGNTNDGLGNLTPLSPH
jgi:hypothetical protein